MVGVTGVGTFFDVGTCVLCGGVPGPGIGKRFFLYEGVADEGIVVASAVERWVGADEVDAFVGHLAEDFKVVTEVEFVHNWLSAVSRQQSASIKNVTLV